jgi:hypothetical protein
MTSGAERHRRAALRHEQAADTHDRSATFWDGRGKPDQAGLQRELASHERTGADLERRWGDLVDPSPANRTANDGEDASSLIRNNAERLSSVLNRTAEALEKTAAIAEEHSAMQEQAGQSDGAAQERRSAERAREFAQRARAQSEDWLKLAPPERP